MALKLRKVKYDKKGHIAYVTIDNAEHENCLEEVVDQDLWTVWHDFRDDQNLYALNTNGTKRWTFPTGGAITASPAIGRDGTIYIGSTASHLLFVPTAARYLMVERQGPPPAPGEELDLNEGTFLVGKLGRAPFPGEQRPCAFLLVR